MDEQVRTGIIACALCGSPYHTIFSCPLGDETSPCGRCRDIENCNDCKEFDFEEGP